MQLGQPDAEAITQAVEEYINILWDRLYLINRSIHENPELAWNEHHAHDTLCDFLEESGFQVTRHAYGMETAFEARRSRGSGRVVNFNLEYDALPGVGHACGHNLIAASGLTAFLALAFVMEKFGIDGTVQILGTPAEENGGGKIVLLEQGAYSGVDASLMIHPMAEDPYLEYGVIGSAGCKSVANSDMIVEFRGAPAHASAAPWDGVNALDAIVLSYNNISALRQHIHPEERIHGCILECPKVCNVIPEHTKVKFALRSPTIDGLTALGERVTKCFEAGALATGCQITIEKDERIYADLRPNEPLCEFFQTYFSKFGYKVLQIQEQLMPGSTDQGNVSYNMPALHALVGIPTVDGENPHTHAFAAAAATQEAHRRAVSAGKAMAVVGWKVLVDEEAYARVRESFEQDKKRR